MPRRQPWCVWVFDSKLFVECLPFNVSFVLLRSWLSQWDPDHIDQVSPVIHFPHALALKPRKCILKSLQCAVFLHGVRWIDMVEAWVIVLVLAVSFPEQQRTVLLDRIDSRVAALSSVSLSFNMSHVCLCVFFVIFNSRVFCWFNTQRLILKCSWNFEQIKDLVNK